MKFALVSRRSASLVDPSRPPTHGGAETQAWELAHELARLGHDVTFIVEQPVRGWHRLSENLRVLFAPFGSGLVGARDVFRALAAADAQIVITFGMGSTTRNAALWCRLRRRRFVYFVMNDYEVDPTIRRTDIDKTRGFGFALRTARPVVAQSFQQHEALLRHRGLDSEILYPGLRPSEPGPPEREALVLAVCRFMPFKRPSLMIQLARRMPRYRFVMVCPIVNPYARREYETLKADIEATPNIEFHPGLPHDQLAALYRRARVLVCTSATEGVPSVFMEAMWAGTPIASLDFDIDGALGAMGLHAGGSMLELEVLTRRLLADETHWREQSARIHRHACQIHDIGKTAARLVFHLERRPPPARPSLDEEMAAMYGEDCEVRR